MKIKLTTAQKTNFLKIFILGLLSGCFHTLAEAQNVSVEWVKTIGAGNYDEGKSVIADGHGYVYATGLFTGTIDFDPGKGAYISGGGNNATFISKMSTTGNHIWTKAISGSANVHGMGIAVDPWGNIYVAGVLWGATVFNLASGTISLNTNGGGDFFVCKLDSAGNFLWAKSIGGSGTENVYGIATDNLGNVYTTGSFQDTVDFNPGTGSFKIGSNGSFDLYISKLDSSGNFVWAKGFGGKKSEAGSGITVDRLSGNVYATGSFQDIVDFNPGSSTARFTSLGNDDIFLLKLNASGNFLWARQIGGTGYDRGQSVAIDSMGNVYSAGRFQDIVDFDPGTNTENLTSKGGDEIYISKFDSSGNYLWAKSMGGTGADWGYFVATDRSGNAYATGHFSGTADFNPGTGIADTFNLRAHSSSLDIFIVKLDARGNFKWAKGYGDGTLNRGYGITVDEQGGIYSIGYFQGTVDFAPGSGNNSNGNNDIFIHKLICSDTSSYDLEATADCKGYEFSGQLYKETGVYTAAFPNTEGCDSIIRLHLTINNDLQVSIRVNVFELSTTLSYKSYQWLLNGETIPGATDSTYTVKRNGNYSVIVEDEYGCRDTSDVYTITNVDENSITEQNLLAHVIQIYPNPATDKVYIHSPVEVNIMLTGIEGKIIRQINAARNFSVNDLASGIYLLHITDTKGHLIKMEKLVKDQ